MNTETTTDIVLKAWDRYQDLIESLGEACWKIRSVFYTTSFAVIAAAFSLDLRSLYWLNLLVALLFCALEVGYQRIQAQYIARALSIERTINDILAGEKNPWLPNYGVSTSLVNLDFKGLLRAFRRKKYLFWLSYLAIVLVSSGLFFLHVTRSRFISASAPVPYCVCPCNGTPQAQK